MRLSDFRATLLHICTNVYFKRKPISKSDRNWKRCFLHFRQTDTEQRRAGVRQRIVRNKNRILRRRRSSSDHPVDRRNGSGRRSAVTTLR